MKKFLVLILCAMCAVCCVTVSACGGETGGETGGEQTSDKTEPENPDSTESENGGSVLVVYFSCTGTTEKIAGYVAEKTGGTLFRILPAVPYTEDDLKYYTDCRADREQADPTARPETANEKISGFDGYCTVFVGYPVWHGQAPKIIYTFLESYDFSGKTIVPFCSSASSPVGTSASNLHSSAAGANWLDGVRFGQSASRTEVNNWIEGLNIDMNDSSKNNALYITVNGRTLTAELAENSAAAALAERLKTAPVTINMSDYGGFEKVGGLGFSLPADNVQITTLPCEFVLYQGNQLVIFYGSNSWSYTRLGKIKDVTPDELRQILGDGEVAVTLSV